SDIRGAALERLATRPPLFKDLREAYPNTLPSRENIEHWLAKRGFTGKGAGKAAETYLATMRLVSGDTGPYNPVPDDQEEPEMPESQHVTSTGGNPPKLPAPRIVMNGTRLEIQATVDREGLTKLVEVLRMYEKMFDLM